MLSSSSINYTNEIQSEDFNLERQVSSVSTIIQMRTEIEERDQKSAMKASADVLNASPNNPKTLRN